MAAKEKKEKPKAERKPSVKKAEAPKATPNPLIAELKAQIATKEVDWEMFHRQRSGKRQRVAHELRGLRAQLEALEPKG